MPSPESQSPGSRAMGETPLGVAAGIGMDRLRRKMAAIALRPLVGDEFDGDAARDEHACQSLRRKQMAACTARREKNERLTLSCGRASGISGR